MYKIQDFQLLSIWDEVYSYGTEQPYKAFADSDFSFNIHSYDKHVWTLAIDVTLLIDDENPGKFCTKEFSRLLTCFEPSGHYDYNGSQVCYSQNDNKFLSRVCCTFRLKREFRKSEIREFLEDDGVMEDFKVLFNFLRKSSNFIQFFYELLKNEEKENRYFECNLFIEVIKRVFSTEELLFMEVNDL